jgi:C4-dicarboxylate-specific signal transduction histidine kinase
MLLAAEAAKRGVGLRFAPLHPPVTIRGDQIELEQIVFNLVRNAIEAASKEAAGDVSVLARRAEDDIMVEVADNGPGVAIEVSERLFEPFFTTKPGGTGLGLALCRRLAERMEGEVQLVRAHPALFRLRLPVHVPPVGGTLP